MEAALLYKNFTIVVLDFAISGPKYSLNSLGFHRKKSRMYNCELCGYSTKITSRYTDHLRKHTGERPYGCPVCDQRFSVKSNMLRHLNSHKVYGNEGFMCHICYIPFKTIRALSNHAKNHN